MHDELIVEHPLITVDPEGSKEIVQAAMEEASKEIIGWRIKTDATIIGPGERFKPKSEADMETFRFFAKKAGFDV